MFLQQLYSSSHPTAALSQANPAPRHVLAFLLKYLHLLPSHRSASSSLQEFRYFLRDNSISQYTNLVPVRRCQDYPIAGKRNHRSCTSPHLVHTRPPSRLRPVFPLLNFTEQAPKLVKQFRGIDQHARAELSQAEIRLSSRPLNCQPRWK